MFQFLIEIDHRKHGGWNKHEKQCQLDVQAELGKALAQFLVDNYETIEISFKVSLSFSNRSTNPSFTPITRVDKRLFIAGTMEVDWRQKIDANADEMKNFIAQATVVVAKKALENLELSIANFDKGLEQLAGTTGTAYDKSLAVDISPSTAEVEKNQKAPENRLAINIALVDDLKGDEKDAQLGASICQELEKLAEEKNFVMISTACGNGYFSIELSTPDPIALGDELIPWLRMMKLKDGSMINVFFRNGKFIELKRANIGRSAAEEEAPSQIN